MDKKTWFESWFDTPYYHILYGHRDQSEASGFIQNLLNHLNPEPTDHFLDLACGKGRHALEIAIQGFHTTGIDLSTNSINHAKQIDHPLLEFHVGDMRHVHFPEKFNYIFNLFTSFGYFEKKDELLKTLIAINKQLQPGGRFVLDYLNVVKTRAIIGGGVHQDFDIDGVLFSTRKKVSKQFISKQINVTDGTDQYEFFEHVWNLDLGDFDELFEKSGFTVQTIFGDYQLNKFDSSRSDRLIVIVTKH